jgi:hypothetical protein
MITAALPHSKIEGNTYKRSNDEMKLTITNGYEGILPYGSYPRIILSWIITEAIKTRSREIYIGKNISDFMRQLGITISGGKTGSFSRFKQQFLALMTSNITYSFVDSTTKKNVVLNFHIADAIKFSSDNHDDFFKTKIILDELFFNEIMKHPIPVDGRALNKLMSSSLALDIYFWLTYRMNYLKSRTDISFPKLKSQFGYGYDDTKRGRYEFKRKFMIQLKFVLKLYNTAKVSVNSRYISIYPSPTHVKKYEVQSVEPGELPAPPKNKKIQ